MDKHDTMQHEEHENHMEYSNHEMTAQHDGHDMGSMKHEGHYMHSGGHAGHGTDHTGHEQMFRTRFWWSLLLTVPVLLYSSALQSWLGFSMPTFPGSDWISPVFSLVTFGYGGIPFLKMAVPEIQNRKPGMMTLISLAISVALIYSLLAQLISIPIEGIRNYGVLIL